MQREKKNPYQECPIYETEHFIYRLVEEKDAEDLLKCYADPRSAKIFNSDNCLGNFVFQTVEEVRTCISAWLAEYKQQHFVRFSIVEKRSNKAIGTIEIFAREETLDNIGKLGVLRLDLASEFETEEIVQEILVMIEDNFFDDFAVNNIITKAIPEAIARIAALENRGYQSIEKNRIVPYADYFMKRKF